MLLISFSWCPKVRKLQIKVKRTEDYDFDGDSFDGDDAYLIDEQRIRLKTARQRITAITSMVKLCLTPFVAALFAKIFGLNVFFRNLNDGFKNLGQHNLLPLFLVHIVCGYFSQVLGRLGCKLGLQRICFALPLILSTPISIILVGAFDGCKFLNLCLCYTKLSNANFSNEEVRETLILAIILWLAQIFSTTIYVWQSQDFLMAKESMLFWIPCYDGENYSLVCIF